MNLIWTRRNWPCSPRWWISRLRRPRGALAVPKAAVSRAVADLEKALGVRVLERTTRRISSPPRGACCTRTQSASARKRAAPRAIAKLQSPEARPLRVVADPTYGGYCSAPGAAVSRGVRARAAGSGARCAAVGRSAWDVAIRTARRGRQRDATPVGRAARAAVRDTAYLQRRGMPARPDDLPQPRPAHADAAELPEFACWLERGAQRAKCR